MSENEIIEGEIVPVDNSEMQRVQSAILSGLYIPQDLTERVVNLWGTYRQIQDMILSDADYIITVVTPGPQAKPKVVSSMEEAQREVERIKERTGGRIVPRIDKQMRKRGLVKLARAFNIAVNLEGDLEVTVEQVGERVLIRRVRGSGYALDVYMRITPDGMVETVRADANIVVERADGKRFPGVGTCSLDERGFSKPNHDIVAMAETRALVRALSAAIGTGQVAAEELIVGGEDNIMPTEITPVATEKPAIEPPVEVNTFTDLVRLIVAKGLTLQAVEERFGERMQTEPSAVAEELLKELE